MVFLDKTISTIKGSPIGFVVGAYAGYYVSGKYVKIEKMWQKLAIAFIGGIVGSVVEYKITSQIGLSKTKEEIKGK